MILEIFFKDTERIKQTLFFIVIIIFNTYLFNFLTNNSDYIKNIYFQKYGGYSYILKPNFNYPIDKQNQIILKKLKELLFSKNIKSFPEIIEGYINIPYKNENDYNTIVDFIKQNYKNYDLTKNNDKIIFTLKNNLSDKNLLKQSVKVFKNRVDSLFENKFLVTINKNNEIVINVIDQNKIFDKQEERMLKLNELTFNLLNLQQSKANESIQLEDINGVSYYIFKDYFLDNSYIEKFIFDLSLRKPSIKVIFKKNKNEEIKEIINKYMGLAFVVKIDNEIILISKFSEQMEKNTLNLISDGSHAGVTKIFNRLTYNQLPINFDIVEKKLILPQKIDNKNKGLLVIYSAILILVELSIILIYIFNKNKKSKI